MKRAREPSNDAVGDGKYPATGSARASAPAPAPAPAPARAVTAGSPKPAKGRETSAKPTSSASPLVPLPPPPPIQPFSDDSGEEDGASAGVSSSSSSSSGSSVDGGETKRARKEQTEVAGWRTRALAIMEGGKAAGDGESGSSRKKFAVVCSSNVNRSIMAEILLQKHDMRVRSFGTGREVKLPGKDSKSPQSFPFGTPYVEIRDFLARQNEALFRRNSVLGLLERDAATKRAPERWQSLDSEDVASFDVVVCFESRVFDLVVEDLQQRDPDTFKPLHVVSMTIRDSAEDSAAAAGDVLELCKMLDDCDDLNSSEASELLSDFKTRSKRTVLHQVCHI